MDNSTVFKNFRPLNGGSGLPAAHFPWKKARTIRWEPAGRPCTLGWGMAAALRGAERARPPLELQEWRAPDTARRTMRLRGSPLPMLCRPRPAAPPSPEGAILRQHAVSLQQGRQGWGWPPGVPSPQGWALQPVHQIRKPSTALPLAAPRVRQQGSERRRAEQAAGSALRAVSSRQGGPDVPPLAF